MARSRVWLLIAALCGLMACSKNESTPEVGGQYLFRDAQWTVSVYMSGDVTVFKDGHYVFQGLGMSAVGSYPTITISGSGLSMSCSFSGEDSFTGKILQDPGIGLPSSMSFYRDATPLDRNGDGVLD